jgi:hypothetical protein
MTEEILPIPYLSPGEAELYHALGDKVRGRVIAASRAVAEGMLGYKKAGRVYDVAEVIGLVQAIVQPIRNREQPPPWQSAVLEPTSPQQFVPAANLLPAVDTIVELDVGGAKTLSEFVADGRLTAAQATAVMMLALGEPTYQVADKLRVQRTVVYEWRRKPAFVEAYGLVVRERAESLMAKLDDAQTLALSTLVEALQATTIDRLDKEVPDWDARLKAAKELLDRGGRALKTNRMVVAASVMKDDMSLEDRIAKLMEEERELEEDLRRLSTPLTVIEGGR